LLRTTRVNGLKENKGKRTSQKHPNSFPMILLRALIFCSTSASTPLTSFFTLNVDRPQQAYADRGRTILAGVFDIPWRATRRITGHVSFMR
jgi:hypothetical protein